MSVPPAPNTGGSRQEPVGEAPRGRPLSYPVLLRLPHYWGRGGLLFLLLLTGCGDDRPQTQPDYQPPSSSAAPPPAIAPASSDSPPDALVGGGSTDKTYSDPLLSQDPLGGPKMPTDHSHWLRGRIRNAHVTVRLNGIRQGAYSSLVDQDVTMRLRKGINSVTFTYQPDSPAASAQMEVVESEHTPPIPPLVTFVSPPAPEGGKLAPVTQTFSFVAR